jgi:hypothetical protein
LTDIILDTNAFRIFIDEKAEEFIKKVIEDCDNIYVPRNIDKELKGRFYALLNLMYKLLRKLGRKFHEVSSIESELIPNRIEEELRRCGADFFDLKVAKLAFKTREKAQEVCLVSNDPHFQKLRGLFENYGISVRTLEEFKNEYLSSVKL